MPPTSARKSLSTLIDHWQVQENLLQSYRTLSITLQTLLLLIGSLSLNQILGAEEKIPFFIVQLVVFTFSLFVTIKFMDIIQKRGNDVTFWQRQILHAEQNLPKLERNFTVFKKYQREKSKNIKTTKALFANLKKLTDAEIETLLGKGKGSVRRFIDLAVSLGIVLVWTVIVAASYASLLAGNV